MNIKKISSIEILDSRGIPTLKTIVELESGIRGWAAVPSGASTGAHEAHELRDGDPHRYMGKGVLTAKHNVDVIINDLLVGHNVFEQEKIDHLMIKEDGSENKKKLGANAMLSVSLACARAAAAAKNLELYEYLAHFFGTTTVTMPVPMINVVNGGKHAEQSSDFQEYMLIPYGFTKFSEAIRAAAEVFQTLKKKMSKEGRPTSVGDEGGFTLKTSTNNEPLQYLVDAVTEAGYVPGEEFGFGLDVAATELFADSTYNLKCDGEKLDRAGLLSYYKKMADNFPLVSIEDGFAEDDWQGFVDLQKALGTNIQTVGDDLYVTNVERLKKGIALKASNAILVKVNQIGTLSETIETIKLAKEAKMEAVISHRSGETEDPFIADLVIASGAGQIKTGSMSRSDRMAKYNRLLEIEAHEKEHAPESLTYYDFPFKTK